MALEKDRDRSQSPDRNWRRRLSKRDMLLQIELSASKQKTEQDLIRTANDAQQPLPRHPNLRLSTNSKRDDSVSSQKKHGNRNKLLLSPANNNMRLSVDEDALDQKKKSSILTENPLKASLISQRSEKKQPQQPQQPPAPKVTPEQKQKAEQFHA